MGNTYPGIFGQECAKTFQIRLAAALLSHLQEFDGETLVAKYGEVILSPKESFFLIVNFKSTGNARQAAGEKTHQCSYPAVSNSINYPGKSKLMSLKVTQRLWQ